MSKVRVNGTKARFAKPNKHELRVWPSRKILAGERFTVKVTYAGQPAKIGYLGEKNWLATKNEVVAMSQPHMAPWWFPANDHPQDRALMRIHITVPRGKQAIANGRPRPQDKRADTTTWHWRPDEPMIPYLAFFAAGDFAIRARHERRSAVAQRCVAATDVKAAGALLLPAAGNRRSR